MTTQEKIQEKTYNRYNTEKDNKASVIAIQSYSPK